MARTCSPHAPIQRARAASASSSLILQLLAAAVVALALARPVAAAASVSGCRSTQQAQCTVADAARERAALQRCNFLNEQNLNWVGEDTLGSYPPKAFNNSLLKPGFALARQPFMLGQSLVLRNDTLYYVDEDPSQGPEVFSLHSEGLAAVHQPFSEIAAKMPLDDPFGFNFAPMQRLDRVYQQTFVERRRVLRLDSADPRYLTASHQSAVAWVERRGNGSDLVYFDVANAAPLAMSLRPLPAGAFRVSPAACGPYLAYAEFDSARGTSAVFAYHVRFNSTERLTPLYPLTRVASFFRPVMDVASAGSDVCQLAWAEVGGTVALDPATLAVLEPSDGLAVTLSTLTLPDRTARSFAPASYASGPYVRLEGYALSRDTLVAQLSTADRSAWMLRAYSYSTSAWRDLPLTQSTSALALQGSDAGRFLYLQTGSGARPSALFVLDPSALPFGGPPQLCSALEWGTAAAGSQEPVAVTLYQSLLAYAAPLPDGSARLCRMDLDKDNDGLFDIEDRFPLLGLYTHDSDNDGIADEADLVAASGSCVDSATPGACPSDYVVLYAVYGGIMLLLTVTGVVSFHMRRTRLRRHVQARDSAGHRLDVPHIFRFRGNAEIRDYLGPAASATLAASNAEDDKTLHRVDRRRQILKALRVMWDGFILLVIVFSVLLAIVPWLPYSQQLKPRHALLWADLFVSSFLALDVLARIVYRDRVRQPHLHVFLQRNWFEFPSLVTDLPGATVVLGGAYQGVPGLVSLYVVLRTLKVTRVVRLYFRVSRNRRISAYIADRPFHFLALFMLVLLVLAALSIKTHEEYASVGFESVWDAFWFVMVTATTVGYGDIVTRTVWGRALAIFVASLGIGMLGMLSAKMVQSILAADGMQKGLMVRKAEMQRQRSQQRSHMERMAAHVSPINAALKTGSIADDPVLLRNAMAPRAVRFIDLAEADTNLPVEDMIGGGGGGGKFKMHELKGGQNYARNTRRRKQVSLLRADADVAPETVLAVVLKHYGIYSGSPTLPPALFAELWSELQAIIFDPLGPHEGFLERCFTVKRHLEVVDGEPPYGYYADHDPIALKMQELDDLFRRFNLHERPDFAEIRSQIRIVLLQNDRLANARWATSHLEYRTEVKPAPPVTNPHFDPDVSPSPDVVPLVVPRSQASGLKKKKSHSSYAAS